ncbi:hypothetical protein [uncultured Clostridium sp.]|uniref:hypothetical protein n=1 Tax=uncultured Clostridium sp. TaxID=59620 RepID=UPI002590E037|nr:hypothetical protein [uncultured Clostridium sp.]
MKKTNHNFNKLNSNYLNSIEKDINFYLLQNDSLILYFKDINFKKYSIINVYLKNIKTREVLKCISKVEDNRILIDLSNLKYLCTDYEYSIIVVLETLNSYNIMYPKFNNKDKEKSIISHSNTDNIQWYLRILENGKLRLSTIYLFSNISNNFKNEISL